MFRFTKYIRNKVAHHNLDEAHRKIIRERKNLSIEEAQSILLIYLLKDEESYKSVQNFADELKGKNKTVNAVAFTTNKSKYPWYTEREDECLLLPSDIQWDLKPKNENLTKILQTHYDMLIDLSLEISLPALYVSALSTASMKIGAYDEHNKKYFDLMIRATPETTVEEQINQMLHYVNMINQN